MTAPSPEDAATALLATNRRRRRIRRWVAIGALPASLAALVLVVKLLGMYAFAYQSISSYVVADYAGSETAAQGQGWWNVFDPYKAPYNEGTALAGGERLPEARAKLEEALELASGLEVCAVRINLAIVIERMGDAARADGDPAAAAERYGEALEVTVGTPEECSSAQAQEQSPDPSRDMSDTLDDQQDRLQQKQREQEQSQGQNQDQNPQPDDDQGQQQDQPSQGQLDDIEDRLGEGQQEREDDLGDDGQGGGTDRPW